VPVWSGDRANSPSIHVWSRGSIRTGFWPSVALNTPPRMPPKSSGRRTARSPLASAKDRTGDRKLHEWADSFGPAGAGK
jgi:hypothetical protein